MEFVYDPTKSETNEEKHGISFEHATLLWLDEKRLVVPARFITEPREALIARLDGKLWTAIYTLRKNAIRLISVRRSRDEEKEAYDYR
ncbi:MAG: BrnT family toxin [Verrucomicrobia bacterium]|nr:BrnT family toxin [Verrucomicrobiota bacterium]